MEASHIKNHAEEAFDSWICRQESHELNIKAIRIWGEHPDERIQGDDIQSIGNIYLLCKEGAEISSPFFYSTVTDLAKFLGLSTSHSLNTPT